MGIFSPEIARLTVQVMDACRAKGWRIATAESCTGGLLSAAFTDIAGSSDVFDRGYVTYSNDAKSDMIGVTKASLAAFGAVSEQVAHEMALGALIRSKAHMAISITGIAGPGGSEHKPEGRVCFAVALKNEPVICKTCEFGAIGRENVRKEAMVYALRMLLGGATSDQK